MNESRHLPHCETIANGGEGSACPSVQLLVLSLVSDWLHRAHAPRFFEKGMLYLPMY